MDLFIKNVSFVETRKNFIYSKLVNNPFTSDESLSTDSICHREWNQFMSARVYTLIAFVNCNCQHYTYSVFIFIIYNNIISSIHFLLTFILYRIESIMNTKGKVFFVSFKFIMVNSTLIRVKLSKLHMCTNAIL